MRVARSANVGRAMNVPDDLRYSTDHEWVRVEDGRVRIGITDYAQDALGDVVFVQVPDGRRRGRGRRRAFSEVESTKSVSDIYAPVTGTVVEVNAELADAPERVNEDPYGEGWICVIEPADPPSSTRCSTPSVPAADRRVSAMRRRAWTPARRTPPADLEETARGRRLLQQLRAPQPAGLELLLVVRRAARDEPGGAHHDHVPDRAARRPGRTRSASTSTTSPPTGSWSSPGAPTPGSLRPRQGRCRSRGGGPR